MRNGWKRSIAVLLVFCVLCAAFPLGLESIAAAAADPAGMVGAASGKTGEVNWKLNGSTLTIYGEGKMEEDYGDLKYYKGPWKDYRKSIKSVVVDEGVTLVGQRAFHGCESLTSISIAESVEYIGGYAFEGTPWEMKSSAPNSTESCFPTAWDGSAPMPLPFAKTSVRSSFRTAYIRSTRALSAIAPHFMRFTCPHR